MSRSASQPGGASSITRSARAASERTASWPGAAVEIDRHTMLPAVEPPVGQAAPSGHRRVAHRRAGGAAPGDLHHVGAGLGQQLRGKTAQLVGEVEAREALRAAPCPAMSPPGVLGGWTVPRGRSPGGGALRRYRGKVRIVVERRSRRRWQIRGSTCRSRTSARSGQRVSNWGKWAPDDEKGTVNYITPDKLIAAGKLIKQGQDLRPRHPLRARRAATGRRPHQPRPPHEPDR